MTNRVVVKQFRLVHDGGTKEYNLTLVQDEASGSGVWIKRFGKLNARGEIMCGGVMPLAEAQREFDKTLRQKEGRGYKRDGAMRMAEWQREAFQPQVPELDPEHRESSVVATLRALVGDSSDPFRVPRTASTREERAPEELFGKTNPYADNPDFGSF